MELNLKGKRVLVTGASKGIGRACVEMLRKEGCTVLGASRTITGADTMAIDIAAPGAAQALADWAGDLDILVNNAGAIPGGDLLKVDEATWRKAWDLKLFGYINLTRAVYARMKAKKRGVIVNVIGAAGEKMNALYIAGSAANASIMAFTKALGGASHADGIRVVGINPGPVETDRLVSLHKQQAATKFGDESRYKELFKDMSFGRPATPEEIANAVAFLASDRSAYTSGTILTIDGGQSNR
jgi:NAD(P)-dependent dehydrogenase (short-subunit alcohol dehydrogenase family)